MALDLKAMLCGDTKRMSHVWRYSSIPVSRRENVAEHTFYVGWYALLIAKDLEGRGEYPTEQMSGSDGEVRFPIDYAKMLIAAQVHDLDECLTGDILRSVKYGHPELKKALDESAKQMMDWMTESLGIDVREEWANAKDHSLEGEIIHLADLLHVLSYLIEELRAGNQHMIFIAKELEGNLGALTNPKSKIYLKHKCLHIYAEGAEAVCRELRSNIQEPMALLNTQSYTP